MSTQYGYNTSGSGTGYTTNHTTYQTTTAYQPSGYNQTTYSTNQYNQTSYNQNGTIDPFAGASDHPEEFFRNMDDALGNDKRPSRRGSALTSVVPTEYYGVEQPPPPMEPEKVYIEEPVQPVEQKQQKPKKKCDKKCCCCWFIVFLLLLLLFGALIAALVVLIPRMKNKPATPYAVCPDEQYASYAFCGLDPASYKYRGGKPPVRGQLDDDNLKLDHDDVTFAFVGEPNKYNFKNDPRMNMPAFGGYSVVGVADWEAKVADLYVYSIYKDTTYVFSSSAEKNRFDEDPEAILKEARTIWKDLWFPGRDP